MLFSFSEVLDDITAPTEGVQVRRGRVDVRAVDRNRPAGILARVASAAALRCAKPEPPLRRYSGKRAFISFGYFDCRGRSGSDGHNGCDSAL